ncbi:RES family NAD+ phosphorylase [Xenorhabdus sp. BG5]|uniref:RES family NAD+ phosphorylase n=1 Tax=Xenorhabdus sp. BG5 TaxID=2782014 RepID=UPI00187EA111|nr:RES family NAD+ phosphorylase [Xenorhabdus sp. BG5]MBE8596050.1 RES family NAD+ phosphorylase [Xenorhabdus sp. BG5]
MNEIIAYRLVKRKWLNSAFDGEGARLYGGRWNSRGRPCVYLASSESLAMLEVMVHLDDYSLLLHYALLEVKLPAEVVLHLPSEQLPEDWRDEPAPPSTAEIGDGWLESGESLALAVPSVVVPRELNYIINPAHPLFEQVTGNAAELDFRPDGRL